MELLDSTKYKVQSTKLELPKSELFSLIYHDIFDYPLTLADLIKWRMGKSSTPLRQGFAGQAGIKSKNGFYFLEGRDGLIYKRLLRQRISKRKLEIAQKAAQILGLIPTVKTVGITGALAMGNAAEESDIDLLIVTKKGTLWTTRLISYFVTWLLGIKIRKPNDKEQKDKLCLNMWLDESSLILPKKDRNIYTSHEICQIIPLINKDKTYEKFLYKNKWILEYWPNAIKTSSKHQVAGSMRNKNPLLHATYYMLHLFENLAFRLQYFYMKSKMTREVVTPTRALFHPIDWGSVVLSRFSPPE